MPASTSGPSVIVLAERRSYVAGSRDVYRRLLWSSQKITERAEIDVQILRLEPKLIAERIHGLFESHQTKAQLFDRLLWQVTIVDPPKGLPLHELSQQLHDGEHQSTKIATNVIRVRLDSRW